MSEIEGLVRKTDMGLRGGMKRQNEGNLQEPGEERKEGRCYDSHGICRLNIFLLLAEIYIGDIALSGCPKPLYTQLKKMFLEKQEETLE